MCNNSFCYLGDELMSDKLYKLVNDGDFVKGQVISAHPGMKFIPIETTITNTSNKTIKLNQKEMDQIKLYGATPHKSISSFIGADPIETFLPE